MKKRTLKENNTIIVRIITNALKENVELHEQVTKEMNEGLNREFNSFDKLS